MDPTQAVNQNSHIIKLLNAKQCEFEVGNSSVQLRLSCQMSKRALFVVQYAGDKMKMWDVALNGHPWQLRDLRPRCTYKAYARMAVIFHYRDDQQVIDVCEDDAPAVIPRMIETISTT
jgi:hypothetical protein